MLSSELSRSVGENRDLGRVHSPHCVRSVLMTSVKIPPFLRLIRAEYSRKTRARKSLDYIVASSFCKSFVY